MAGRRLLILGGGFGGLDVARTVARSRVARAYWSPLLVDKENFFQFNPLLPAVAAGGVETRHIVYPLRDMARHRGIRFVKNKVVAIDLTARRVTLHNGLAESWDTLVVALGSETNYYGIPGAAEHTRPFKTVVDAMTLRARVVELFEMAEQAERDEQRRRLLSFLVVGGGVTGVEVAAELTDMVRATLLPRYPSLRAAHVSIVLLERGDRLIPSARPKHAEYVRRFLERRGVEVRLGARVTRVEDKRVHLAEGPPRDAFTIVWTAGVCPPAVVRELPLQHHADGRVRVDGGLRALDPGGAPLADVYVAGDCAACDRGDGVPHPMLAQTAIHMGGHVGAALVRRATGRGDRSFGFHESGYIISLGRHSSVLDIFGVPLSGRLAWLAWAFAYLVKMVGFRKQLEVGLDHLIHLVFEHDASQILARRAVLSDAELELSLGARDPREEAVAPRPPTP